MNATRMKTLFGAVNGAGGTFPARFGRFECRGHQHLRPDERYQQRDGMISKDEIMKRATMAFDKMDAGKKGMVDDKKTIAFLAELSKTDGSNGAMVSRADFWRNASKWPGARPMPPRKA